LPDGPSFDDESGIISGTPTAAGEFTFRIEAEDETDEVTRSYTIVVAAAGQELPPHALVDTGALPVGGGSTSGDGAYDIGEIAQLVAVPEAGYEFVYWEEKGKMISEQAALPLTVDINHSVVATFAIASHSVATVAQDAGAGSASGGGEFADGEQVTVTATANGGFEFVNWTESGSQVSDTATYVFNASADRGLVANFTTTGGATHALIVTLPADAGGSVIGTGNYIAGSSVSIVAQPDAGFSFVRWLDGLVPFSTEAAHSFVLDAPLDLSAEFALIMPDATLGYTAGGAMRIEWPADLPGWVLEQSDTLTPGSWVESTAPIQTDGATKSVEIAPAAPRFHRLTHP
jgi:hypothetical protein